MTDITTDLTVTTADGTTILTDSVSVSLAEGEETTLEVTLKNPQATATLSEGN